ncbi:MBOAT family O-acyltransferase [Sphingomonas aracearum]|nr:MBOAT family O-acyltransferase [Sphingomonas aracearum]
MRLQRLVPLWLTAASLLFYCWWRPANLPLLMGSMVFNYVLAGRLMQSRSKALLAAGVVANLLLLGVFKYTGFVAENLAWVTGAGWNIPHVILPLAISFFTFQQIAYLVDAHGGRISERNPINYCLFITFFPHLIAGPITHHGEMLSQFSDQSRFRPRWDFVGVGLTLFLIGLFKKVVVADPFGVTASPVFAAAAHGGGVRFVEAWTGALSYALQLYFDFSGYSDMAIGLGLLFGIALPLNFDSPYKARNIIDFWSRWHMTLTRFLTAYVYNPIVVSLTRRRAERRLPLPRRGRMSPGTFVALVAIPTVLTMLISGIWHGAGWQFVIFGLLHGLYLTVAHAWRTWRAHRGAPVRSDAPLVVVGSVLLTFLCVVVAQVFFRAENVAAALDMLRGMAGLNGITLPQPFGASDTVRALAGRLGIGIAPLPLFEESQAIRIVLFLAVVWTFPNAYQWLRGVPTALDARPRASWVERFTGQATWQPSVALGLAVGCLSFLSLMLAVSKAPTEFLYFRF